MRFTSMSRMKAISMQDTLALSQEAGISERRRKLVAFH